MQSFDILLFKGTDVVSMTISKLEKLVVGTDQFAHVGVVLCGSDFPKNHRLFSDSITYVFESTMSGNFTDGVVAADDGKSHLGVQIRDFGEVLKSYSGDIAWGRLLPQYRKMVDSKKMVVQEYIKYNSLNYDALPLDLLGAVFPEVRVVRDSGCLGCLWLPCRKFMKRGMFCSELVTCIYKDIGIIPKTVCSSNVVPVDFLTKDARAGITWDSDCAIPVLFESLIKLK